MEYITTGGGLVTHLEKLTWQYYDWKGYLVKGNIKVCPRINGGWDSELDIVAYHPKTKHLLHIEPSLDAFSWSKREERFNKKFGFGREYIKKEVFPWLSDDINIEQIAILITSTRRTIAGANVISVDEFMKEIRDEITKEGLMQNKAIPEQYDLLRTIQMAINGYAGLV